MLKEIFIYTDEVDPECDVLDVAYTAVEHGDYKDALEEAKAYVAKEFPGNKKMRFFKLTSEEIL